MFHPATIHSSGGARSQSKEGPVATVCKQLALSCCGITGDQRSIRASDLLPQLALFGRRNVNCHIRSRVQDRASLSLILVLDF
jgi:hypothetical protein